jgi:hypothetical protein
MKKHLIAKYNKKINTMYCPKCKTYDVMCDGSGSLELPVGFGYIPNDTKFSVATVKMTGYFGDCEHCRERIFNYTAKKANVKYPKKINDKIDNAQFERENKFFKDKPDSKRINPDVCIEQSRNKNKTKIKKEIKGQADLFNQQLTIL